MKYEDRLEAAQAAFDKAHEDVRIHLHLFNDEVKSRLPDTDDWDDTLYATVLELRRCLEHLKTARRFIREGS